MDAEYQPEGLKVNSPESHEATPGREACQFTCADRKSAL
jgi:hypothetical protein